MAIEAQVNQTKVLQGPIVAGQPTVASVFSTKELRRTSFLPSLLKIINAAYAISEASKPELKMSVTTDRLGSIEDLFSNLRDDPESFTVVVSYPNSTDVIGTASVRRYCGPPEDNESPWLRRLPVEPNTEEWELKLMATDPIAQRCGVATFMVDLTEREIVRRHQQKTALGTPGTIPDRVRMVLCTPTELFGTFYSRRGYQKDYENFRGEGHNFHIIFMSKLLHDGAAMLHRA